jgi:murein L,D-transpeptidase YafK
MAAAEHLTETEAPKPSQEKSSPKKDGSEKLQALPAKPAAAREKPTEPPTRQEELRSFLSEWKTAWEETAGPNGDMTAYMSFYAEDFSAGGHDKASWQKDKMQKNSKRAWISGKLLDIDIAPSPDPGKASLRFYLEYNAPNYSEILDKTFDLRKGRHGWQIVSEKTRLATGRYKGAR